MLFRRRGRRSLATVLFTDIVGSTDLAARLGDRQWRELLHHHHEVVRKSFRRFRGREVDNAGDGFFAIFREPTDAVRCAEHISEQVHPLGLTLRIGIHTGEIESLGRKVAGIAVVIGSRVMNLAGSDEVLVSSTVRDLVAGSGMDFEDAGTHHLKGVPGTWQVFRLLRASQPSPELTPGRRRGRGALFAQLAGVGLVAAVVLVAVRPGDATHRDPTSSDRASHTPSPPVGRLSTRRPSPAIDVTRIELHRDASGYAPAQELTAGTYMFAVLRPAVTFRVEGAGWYAYVADIDAVGLVLDAPSSPPGLQTIGGISMGSVQVVYNDPCDLADTIILDSTPEALIEWFQANELLETSTARPVTVGGFPGLEIDAALSGGGCYHATRVPIFPVAQDVFHLSAGTRLRVITLNVPTQPFTMIVQFEPEADAEVVGRVEQLLESIEIDVN